MGNKWKNMLKYWKCFIVIFGFVLLSAIIINKDTKESRCGYCVAVMALFWCTGALPLEITSLLPVVMLPLLGILDTGTVSKEYFSGANMMFLAAMGVAAAVEKVGLHRRLALRVLMVTGTGKKSLLVSFIFITCLLSMFICNTATTAMIVPILQVVLDQVYSKSEEDNKQKDEKEKVMFYLGVAYAANIGGTGTLTASAPNVILKGLLSELFPCQKDLNYATWLLYCLPTILLLLVITTLWLLLLFYRRNRRNRRNKEKEGDTKINSYLRGKYKELGSTTFGEMAVGFYFLLLVLIWFFEEPEFIPGWAESFPMMGSEGGTAVDEATPAMLILVLICLTPQHLNFWPLKTLESWEKAVPPPTLLQWSDITSCFPWGLLMLRGAGFALARASSDSGLSAWLGSQLSSLSSLSDWKLLIIICLVTSFVTEVCSNSATANILLPVMADLAVSLQMNPLYLMLPVTITCCYAFMLPVSTPPNAIVYQASGMKTSQMMMAGLGLNLVTLALAVGAANTYGTLLLDMDTFPNWANLTEADC